MIFASRWGSRFGRGFELDTVNDRHVKNMGYIILGTSIGIFVGLWLRPAIIGPVLGTIGTLRLAPIDIRREYMLVGAIVAGVSSLVTGPLAVIIGQIDLSDYLTFGVLGVVVGIVVGHIMHRFANSSSTLWW